MNNIVKGIDSKGIATSTNAQHSFNKERNIVNRITCLIWQVDEKHLFTHMAR